LRARVRSVIPSAIVAVLSFSTLLIAQATFRNAPASAAAKNPYANSASAEAAGKTLFAKNCAQCHGNNRQGMGPAPALDSEKIQKANAGEVAWFIGTGNPSSGMPAWPNLTKQQKWQIVSFLQSKSK